MNRPLKPKLTRRLMAFMLLDGLGLFAFSLGLASLVAGGPVLFRDFPGSTAEAVVMLASGVVIMLYAVVQVMREMGRQSFEQHEQTPKEGEHR
jgi:membrane protein implicated in regulation of membrane protease activity